MLQLKKVNCFGLHYISDAALVTFEGGKKGIFPMEIFLSDDEIMLSDCYNAR